MFRSRPQPLKPASLEIAAAAGDGLAIMAVTLLVAWATGTPVEPACLAGALLAGCFLSASSARHDYQLARLVEWERWTASVVTSWGFALCAALAIAFMTDMAAKFSRAGAASLFVAGVPALVSWRWAVGRFARQKVGDGQVVAGTAFLFGLEDAVRAFMDAPSGRSANMRIVGAQVLREQGIHGEHDLALATASARLLRPDAVFLLLPWTDPGLVTDCVEAFRRLPVVIHLGPVPLPPGFGAVQADAGPVASLRIEGSPLSRHDALCKRVLDVVASATALVLISPVLVVVAAAIKLDSPGPLLFRQRRYGLNQKPFRILKFRSMSTLEDCAALRQVTANDERVTRVGRVLRRTSIDELPQLINVLKGDMSLVGPRPHALAHDQLFARTYARYARRHTIRPGITGWAQVNGWRGETDMPEKIEGRIAHDLHYVDNWSIWFDISILVRTLLSPSTFRNAR